MIKIFRIIPVLLLFCFFACASSETQQPETSDDEEIPSEFLADFVLPQADASLPISVFDEVWAYLLDGSEETLRNEFPLSDVGYFGAEIDAYGKLVNVPDHRKVSFYQGRLHLVIACNGRALTHFALLEGRPERTQLIADLLRAAEPYDGLQIDFEYVPQQAGAAFLSFLIELRQGLGDKIFSVALPARTRTLQNDVYDYARILPHVDRILVMAYDEHWSTSAPGPVASMPWSRNVGAYSIRTIGAEKLIMGLPFYGRTWGDIAPNRAFFHSGIMRLHREHDSPEISRRDGVPTFVYNTSLTVTVFFDDAYSLSSRMEMYRNMGVRSVGFWCLGQETPEIWSLLRLSQ